MPSIQVDRGFQLENFRKCGNMTDVVLHVGQNKIKAHKLILSLYSPYLRTLFRTEGFLESGQDNVELNDLDEKAFERVVSYIYSGELEVNYDTAVNILETATFLQLEDQNISKVVTELVIGKLEEEEVTLEELFHIWNLAVIYDLSGVIPALFRVIDERIEEFAVSSESRLWFDMLGLEEMCDILSRETLCVSSEKCLFDLAICWAQEKVHEENAYDNFLQLLQHVRFTLLDKSFVQKTLRDNFPDYSAVKLKAPHKTTKRLCQNSLYLAEFKTTKMQERGIDDFVDDEDEKSSFMLFDLQQDKKSKVLAMTSTASMIGTANGGYWRPVPRGGRIFQHRHCLYVLGGLVFSDNARYSGEKNRSLNTRKDLLVFNLKTRRWMPPHKNILVAKQKCLVQSFCQANNQLFVFWKNRENVPKSGNEINDKMIVALLNDREDDILEILDLSPCPELPPSKVTVGSIPPSLSHTDYSTCVSEGKIYCVGPGVCHIFCIETRTWSKGPAPPINLAPGFKIASIPPNIFLVGGKPLTESGDMTNSYFVLDTFGKTEWRRFENLWTRLTLVDLWSHSGRLYCLGWQPSRQNVLVELDQGGARGKVITLAVQGSFSRGCKVERKFFQDV